LFQNNSSQKQPPLFLNAQLAATNQSNSTPFNFGAKETVKPSTLQPLFAKTDNKSQ
jgi:hypothetical protein